MNEIQRLHEAMGAFTLAMEKAMQATEEARKFFEDWKRENAGVKS